MNVPDNKHDSRPTAHPHGADGRFLADLKALLDGELAAPKVWLVRAHLWFCPACQEEVRWLKRLGEDMRDLERAVPSPRLRARILAALPEAPPGSPAGSARNPARTLRLTLVPVFTAAAALAVFAIINKSTDPGGAPAGITPDTSISRRNAARKHDLPAERQAAPAVLPVQPPDVYSVAADRMYEKWLQDQDRHESRQIARNRTNWTKFVAAVRAVHGANETDTPIRLALAVPDVNAAESRLNAWAKVVGGSVSGHAHVDGPPVSVAPLVNKDEAVPTPQPAGQSGVDRLVAVRVPVARVASLEPVLRQAGAWGSVSTSRGVPVRRADADGSVVTTRSVERPRTGGHADPDYRTTIGAVTGSGVGGQAAAREGGLALVTLQIQLTSLETPLP